MDWLFSAMVGAAVHAFLAEFGMLALAAACAVGGIVLLAWNLPLFNGIKRIFAYVLFGIAIGLVCYLLGYRARADLDASAELRRQIEAQQALIVEKDRERKAADDERAAAAQRATDADAKSRTMQEAIDAFEKQEQPLGETKVVRIPGKTVVRNVCDPDDGFARGVQRLDAAGGAARSPAAH